MTAQTVSTLIESQLPEFVRNEDPLFIAFMEAYFEYMEQSDPAWNTPETVSQGKAIDRLSSLIAYKDIDTTIDAFSKKIYDEFLLYFPQNTLANRSTILKNAKDFYRSRGSTKSFQFLFRALFGQEITLFQPQTQVFRASAGNYLIETSIRVIGVTIDGNLDSSLEGLQNFIGTQITGESSGVQAIVEKVIISQLSGVTVNELYVTVTSGTRFEDGENVFTSTTDGHNLVAQIFASSIVSITIINGGSGYSIGNSVVFTSNTGNGAAAIVSSVTVGSVTAISPVQPGAGFAPGDPLLFSGSTGTGASGNVLTVISDNFYHPNTYTIGWETIGAYQNVFLNAASYGFPNISSGGNINTTFENTLSTFSLTGLGPISQLSIHSPGAGYITIPSVDASGNTMLKTLGILGRMEIRNAGQNYNVGDRLVFTNPPGSFGSFANANVTSVNASGAIQHVQFQPFGDEIIGGLGYTDSPFPLITINTVAGTGANVVVTALVAHGSPDAVLVAQTNDIGTILSIMILNGGSDYESNPTVNLAASGDGTATAYANVVEGIFTYPGRFLDETGFPSGFNSVLEDQDYFQPYSYVVKVQESLDNYSKQVKALVHPSGNRLWGEYAFVSPDMISVNTAIQGASTNLVNTQVEYGANALSFSPKNLSYLVSNTQLTGSITSKKGTFSGWISLNNIPITNQSMVVYDSMNVVNANTVTFAVKVKQASNSTLGYVSLVAKQANGFVSMDLRSNTQDALQVNNWIHILASWDLQNANTLLYLNNVASQNVQISNNSVIAYNVANAALGCYANGNTTSIFDGCISEVWFDPNTFIDISVLTNRQKFLSTQFLQPVSLGSSGALPTGVNPMIYFKDLDGTNSGNGGNFQIIGTVPSCNSSPSSI